MNALVTRYFTFGQAHAHRVNGRTYDCDCVVKITASDPREVMVHHFGHTWSMEYEEIPDMRLYPRGCFEL